MIRKTILLRKILSHFATSSQLAKYDDLVSVNKGSASHLAFRLLEEYFENINHCENSYKTCEKAEKGIKVNSRSGSYYI